MATRPSNLIVMLKVSCLFPSPPVGEGGAKRRMRGSLQE
jgi:hypothetical protein